MRTIDDSSETRQAKSVSHNLTLVKCLLEAGIANSKDKVLFLLLS